MNNAAIRNLSLIAVRDAIAAGELSSEQVVSAAIEQIERFDSEFAIFITRTTEQALAMARSADQQRAGGVALKPLHGVPITIKDNIDTAGILTTAGAKIFADRVPDRNATCVQQLTAAGAISLGKTNLHEMAMGGTSTNPHYGAVRNPWAPDRIPGGSSGGASAAQSLQIGYAALGTDSAGSVRMPAALCGLVGLKQTHGLVSLTGCVPTGNWTTDHIGPLTRTVADARLMLELMQGHDPSDPHSASRSAAPHAPLKDLKGIRVGIPENYFWDGIDGEVERPCRSVVEQMQAAGAEVVGVKLETIDLLADAWMAMRAESAIFHEPYLRERLEDYGEDLRHRLLASQYILATDYIRGMRVRRMVMQEMAGLFDKVDVLAMPTMPIAAPLIGANSVMVNGVDTPLTGANATLMLRNTYPANQSGLPAISLPAGLTMGGLPVGFQMIGAAFSDYKLLAIAEVVEQLVGFDTTPTVLAQSEASV